MKINEKSYNWSGTLDTRKSTKYIILHHRAGDGDVDSIHTQHLKNGFLGIGYHFYIRKDGSVYRGRPVNVIGAHTQGFNSVSIGICFEGNYEIDQNMPKAQFDAGKELIIYLKKLFGDIEVKEHRAFSATSCPGKYFPFEKIKVKEELVSANDITWELSQIIKIEDVAGFVKALDKAKNENSPLYWGLRKIVNK